MFAVAGQSCEPRNSEWESTVCRANGIRREPVLNKVVEVIDP